MKTVVLANPKAGAGKVQRLWNKLNRTIVGRFGPVEVRFSTKPGDVTELVRQSILEGAERLVVVGGDGTANEAVNGFFDLDGKLFGEHVSLVVLPVGTGSDFGRSIGVAGMKLEQALAQGQDKRIDIGRASYISALGVESSRYFVNISSFGSSGLVVKKVNDTPKHLGSKLSFLVGTVRGLWAYSNQRVRLQVDDHFDEELVINTVAVANGRYFGGSMKVAPEAELNDGMFDIVVMGDLGLSTFLRYGGRIYRGTHLSLPGIRVLRGKKVVATAMGVSDVLIDLDGEQPGRLPVTYDIVPAAISLFAPWERAEAVRAA